MVDDIKDVVLPSEAHFGFGWVDIHIHKVGGHFEQQNAPREFALHRHPFKGGFQGGHHGAVAHIAAVDVEVLHAAAGPAAPGRRDQTIHPVAQGAVPHIQQIPAELPPQHRIHGAAQLAIAGGNILGFALAHKFKPDLRVAEGQMGHHVCDEGSFTGILLQELHPGGGVVEKIPHPNGGANAPGIGLERLLFPSLDPVEAGELRRLGPGQELHPGHAGDGGQRLAPKPQGVDGVQVLPGLDLAGGVADKGGGDILRLDAAAVVAHFDQFDTARFNGDGNLGRSGVNGIFQQFFDH